MSVWPRGSTEATSRNSRRPAVSTNYSKKYNKNNDDVNDNGNGNGNDIDNATPTTKASDRIFHEGDHAEHGHVDEGVPGAGRDKGGRRHGRRGPGGERRGHRIGGD